MDKYSIEEVLPFYYKNVLNESKHKGLKHLLVICNKLGIDYEEIDSDYVLGKEDFQRLKSILHNRSLYEQKSLMLYSSKEVEDILGISNGYISKMVSSKRIEVKTIIKNSYYFDKNYIENIREILSNTIGLEEMTDILREETEFKDFPRRTTRKYFVEVFKAQTNPINLDDVRIGINQKNQFVKYVIENYRPHKKIDDYSPLILKFGNKNKLKFIEDFMLNVEFIDKTKLSEFMRKKYVLNTTKYSSFTHLVPHVVHICRENDLEWFTNKQLDNIYIRQEDMEKYLSYYDFMYYVVTSGDYYTNTEIKSMFGIKETTNVAKYAGTVSFGNTRYIKKEKIDELYYILANSIQITDLMREFGLNKNARTSLGKLLNDLGIEIIDNIPLRDGASINNEDAEKVRLYYKKMESLKSAKNNYEKFKILTSDGDLDTKFPVTYDLFHRFVKDRLKVKQATEKMKLLVRVSEIFLSKLTKEITEYNDAELEKSLFSQTHTKYYKKEFANFLNYCKEKRLTKYEAFFKNEQPSLTNVKDAYSFEQWIEFGKLLFNPGEHLYEDFLAKALDNRMNAMVWLYCSMHYVCGWRSRDIQGKLPFPPLESILNMSQNEVLNYIKNRQFTIEMSQSVVNYVMEYIWKFQKKPGKLERRDNAPSLKLVIANNYVFQIGLLIALCEIHRRELEHKPIFGKTNTEVLITDSVTKRKNQYLFFGEHLLKIFKNEHFSNQRAIKTHMNIIQVESQKNQWSIGYHLSSIFRSHTPNIRGIAPTTQIYLEHINKNNDVDQITYGLIERGTFGFMPYLLLGILNNPDEISDLDLLTQNEKIQEIVPFSPNEIERLVKNSSLNINRVKTIMRELRISNKEDIYIILEKISKGLSPSKMEYSQCLLKCLDPTYCVEPQRTNCVGCDYFVPEMYFLLELSNIIAEHLQRIEGAEKEFDKIRYSHVLVTVYLPIIGQAIKIFGKERVDSFINGKGLKKRLEDLKYKKQFILG